MKLNKIIIFFLITLIISCSRKDKKIIENQNFDIYTFLLNYKIPEQSDDTLVSNKLAKDLDYKDSVTSPSPRYVVMEYGDIFKNNYKYLIIKDQGNGDSYIWFKKNKTGFIKFFERENADPLYIKDSIFDTNNDGANELIVYKHRGGSGPDYKIFYSLNNEGLIKNESIVDEK